MKEVTLEVTLSDSQNPKLPGPNLNLYSSMCLIWPDRQARGPRGIGVAMTDARNTLPLRSPLLQRGKEKSEQKAFAP